MKYLVLGSEGLIGKALCAHLEAYGDTILRCDIKNNSFDEDLRYEFNSYIDELFNEADFVFFLAFDIGGSKYIKKYERTYPYMDNNMRIMANSFAYLHAHKKPFVFASSQMAEMPWSNYGMLKRTGENITRSLGGRYVRFWNVFGDEGNEDPEKYHVVTDFLLNAFEGEIEMRTLGNERRQFLHADDAAEALHAVALNYPNIPMDMSLDITSFHWISIYDLARVIAEPHDAKVIRGTDQDQVQQGTIVEPNKAILEFWQPKLSLGVGLQRVSDALGVTVGR